VLICRDCGKSRIFDPDENTIKVVFAGDENAQHSYQGDVSITSVEVREDDS